MKPNKVLISARPLRVAPGEKPHTFLEKNGKMLALTQRVFFGFIHRGRKL
jgi:hypothetical protein